MVPPLVDEAVKETVCPEQTVVVIEGEMVMVGVTEAFTVTFVVEELTFMGLAQLAFEVSLQ